MMYERGRCKSGRASRRAEIRLRLAVLICVLGFRIAAHAQFEIRGQYVALAQSSPYSMAVGDFNHDGNLDVAVVSYCCPASGVSILLGNGDGTFRPPVQYPVGDQPFSIVAADFNHDGNLDLAVANSLSNYLSILIGNGDGTFQPATETPPAAEFQTFITVGDFNGDGNLDLLSVQDHGDVNVFFGNGDGTFQNPITTAPAFPAYIVAVGDFTGDGILDLATAGQVGTECEVNILLGNGDGTFRQGASYRGGESPESIAVADFSGNGKLDFAVANFQGYGIGVWLGNGDGTFQGPVNYSTAFPIQVTAARLNGDGIIDLIAANFGGGVSVFMGNGDGTFQAGTYYPADDEDNFVAVGDFNGDKKPDIVLADRNGDQITLLLNTGLVTFSPTTPLNFKNQAVGSTSAPQTVTLANTGTTKLNIASMKASAEFAVTSTCGSSVAAGANCTISATFSPTRKGAVRGTITIIDSASTKPQVIEVLGTGT
jgi:hypothetical protein